MDANETDQSELILKDEVYQLVGCAMEVCNELGHGLREKTCERALVREFELQEIAHEQQMRFPVHYKGVEIDTYIPDLIAFDPIVIDTKTIDQITDREIGQMLNYLKVKGLPIGLILNFKNPKLDWRRVVLQKGPTKNSHSSFPSIRHFPDPSG